MSEAVQEDATLQEVLWAFVQYRRAISEQQADIENSEGSRYGNAFDDEADEAKEAFGKALKSYDAGLTKRMEAVARAAMAAVGERQG